MMLRITVHFCPQFPENVEFRAPNIVHSDESLLIEETFPTSQNLGGGQFFLPFFATILLA